MDVKEAVKIIMDARDMVFSGLLREAYDMAIVELQMQDDKRRGGKDDSM